MNILTTLGTYAVYFWVVVTLLLGVLLESVLVWLCFAELTDSKRDKKALEVETKKTLLHD